MTFEQQIKDLCQRAVACPEGAAGYRGGTPDPGVPAFQDRSSECARDAVNTPVMLTGQKL
jgi:hypothetical protein